MANDEHVALLKQGVDAWNAWRMEIAPWFLLEPMGGLDPPPPRSLRAGRRDTVCPWKKMSLPGKSACAYHRVIKRSDPQIVGRIRGHHACSSQAPLEFVRLGGQARTGWCRYLGPRRRQSSHRCPV